MKVKTLAQQLLFSTLRIEAYDASDNPIGVGTGFVLSHELPGYGLERFLVTNKHVVEGAKRVVLYVHRSVGGVPDFKNPMFFNVDDFRAACWGHPTASVDLIVTPISYWFDLIAKDGEQPFLPELLTSIIITEEQAAEMDAVEPILFLGYPNGLYDTSNYVPIFRRGTTASPYQLDYDGRPVFLIDASVFGGSSGSPVFRHLPTIGGQALAQYQLLGIVTEAFFKTDEGTIELRPAPTNTIPVAVTREMLDLGVVFKAHLILETIDSWWEAHKGKAEELSAWRKARGRE